MTTKSQRPEAEFTPHIFSTMESVKDPLLQLLRSHLQETMTKVEQCILDLVEWSLQGLEPQGGRLEPLSPASDAVEPAAPHSTQEQEFVLRPSDDEEQNKSSGKIKEEPGADCIQATDMVLQEDAPNPEPEGAGPTTDPTSDRGRSDRYRQHAERRHFGSCGSLSLSSRTLPPLSTVRLSRGFVHLITAALPQRTEHSESRTLKYTPEQIYDIVANVDQYSCFVPWCKASRSARSRNGHVLAELTVGFPPVFERYISELTHVPNHQIRAVCRDSSLFHHLESVWSFSPGPAPDSCIVDFSVSFEFKSLLHSQLAAVFFKDVAREIVSAFESRANELYRNTISSTKQPKFCS